MGSRSVSTQRFEETSAHRAELEEAKRENEVLRQRVRELEGLIRGRRGSSLSRERGGGREGGGG